MILEPESLIGQDLVIVGRVKRPHALRGWIRVEPEVEDMDIFASDRQVWIAPPGQKVTRYTIEGVQSHSRFLLLKMAGLDTLEQVERFRGKLVYVERSQLPDLPEGSYYYADLIGCQVMLPDGSALGRVTAIESGPGGDVMTVIAGEEATSKGYLIPALKEIVKCIDITNKSIRIDPPEGLL